MNKKIFPVFSLLLMFALALMSFAPAYAAPGKTDVIYPPGYGSPVNLKVVYNPTTSQIMLTAAFADNSVIKRGDVSMSSTKSANVWTKTATLYNTSQIKLNYSIPRGSAGIYCATVTLTGGVQPVSAKPGMRPIPGTASQCVVIPAPRIIRY